MSILQTLTRLDASLLGAVVLLVVLVVLRERWKQDANLRRRTTAIAGVVVAFIVLRAWRQVLPRTVERVVTVPASGEPTAVELASSLFPTVSVVSLIVGFLALLLLTTLVWWTSSWSDA